MKTILKEIRTADSSAQITASGKDIVVKSKDREATKKKVETHLKKKKILFKSIFKKSKSSSLEVLEITGGSDIIFKPIIQKGAGGVAFEKELAADIKNYLNGADYKQLKNPDVIKEMESSIGFNRRTKYDILEEGSKNQRRELSFSGGQLKIANSTGVSLTDVTLEHKNERMYLSLKMSKSYYTLSSSIGAYFAEGGVKIKINEYFGFNGQKMAGFGKQYACVTKKPNYNLVKNNLQSILSQALGTELVLIHKKQTNDVLVKKIGRINKVTINGLDEKSYVYPEKNVRKYANIKVNAVINGHKYVVNFQFRGTTAADVGPRYLRILLERL